MKPTIRRAFTLVDLSIAIAIVGIAVAIVIPTASPSERLQLIGATNTLIADIEFAQSETLANPGAPTIVRFDSDTDSYWIAKKSDPDTPITHPINGDPYRRELNTPTSTLLNITLPSGGNAIAFNDMGALVTSENIVVRIQSSIDDMWILINKDTGFASSSNTEPEYTEPEPLPEPEPEPEPELKDPEEGEGGGIIKDLGGILGL